jgi:hypothetical protein
MPVCCMLRLIEGKNYNFVFFDSTTSTVRIYILIEGVVLLKRARNAYCTSVNTKNIIFNFQHEIFAAHTAHSLNHHTKTTFIMIDYRLFIVSTTQQRSADRRIIKGLSIIIIYNKQEKAINIK